MISSRILFLLNPLIFETFNVSFDVSVSGMYLMMDLSVNIPLEAALDKGWSILSECFESDETGIKSDLIKQYWKK